MPRALGSSSWSGPALGTEHRGKWTQLLKEGCDPTLAMGGGSSQAESTVRPEGWMDLLGLQREQFKSRKGNSRGGVEGVCIFFIAVMLLISPLQAWFKPVTREWHWTETSSVIPTVCSGPAGHGSSCRGLCFRSQYGGTTSWQGGVTVAIVANAKQFSGRTHGQWDTQSHCPWMSLGDGGVHYDSSGVHSSLHFRQNFPGSWRMTFSTETRNLPVALQYERL